MDKKYQFESERLGFRLWCDNDNLPFSTMNANHNVMKYFRTTLTKEESDNFIKKIMNHFFEHNYGLWAVELKVTGEFIGFIGFYTATFPSDFTPCVEIGWRLGKRFWGNGYATEGAQQCLDYGFNTLGLDSIFSFTSEINTPSINVMKKIGLTERGKFMHPNIDDGNPLKPHMLYFIDNKRYKCSIS